MPHQMSEQENERFRLAAGMEDDLRKSRGSSKKTTQENIQKIWVKKKKKKKKKKVKGGFAKSFRFCSYGEIRSYVMKLPCGKLIQ